MLSLKNIYMTASISSAIGLLTWGLLTIFNHEKRVTTLEAEQKENVRINKIVDKERINFKISLHGIKKNQEFFKEELNKK